MTCAVVPRVTNDFSQHIDELMSSAAFRCCCCRCCFCRYLTACRMLPGEVRRVVLEHVTKRDLVPVVRPAPGSTGHKMLL